MYDAEEDKGESWGVAKMPAGMGGMRIAKPEKDRMKQATAVTWKKPNGVKGARRDGCQRSDVKARSDGRGTETMAEERETRGSSLDRRSGRS